MHLLWACQGNMDQSEPRLALRASADRQGFTRISGDGSTRAAPINDMNLASSRSPIDRAVIFDEHFDYVWATLRRLGVPEADREDLVHDVFLKIYTRLADYDETGPIRPWLFVFAYGVAVDHHRLTLQGVEVLGAPIEAVAGNASADDRIAALEQRELILEALQTLALDRRAVLVMHDVDDVAMPQIAHSLEIPLDVAYSRLRLAREQLASAVIRLRIARGVQ
jgi:RNA polymerase sigma-70 factor (ECF subfamily)